MAHSMLGATLQNLPGFALRESLPTGYMPTSVATGDFNRDGNTDFVVSNGYDNNLYLYFGHGDGTFDLPVILPLAGESPLSVATADLRGNGMTDLVVAEVDSNSIGILLGNGDGTFSAETQIFVPGGPTVVVTNDFNGDGKPDIVATIAANSSAFIAMLPGDGSGNFGPPVISGAATASYNVSADAMVARDLNGDGVPDLLITVSANAYLGTRAYLNDGHGGFIPANQLIDSNGVDNLLTFGNLADVNSDGCADALTIHEFGAVQVFPGNCSGLFDATSPLGIPMGDEGATVSFLDVTGDGRGDIVATGYLIIDIHGTGAGDLLSVAAGDGVGHFSNAKVFRGGTSMYAVAFADFNHDGAVDAVAVNQENDSVTVFLNDGTGNFGDPQGVAIGYSSGPVNAPISEMTFQDVNGDGKPDAILIEYPDLSSTNYQLAVMLNDGTGHFSPPIRSPIFDQSTHREGWVVADFRGTGKPDFLAVGLDGAMGGTPFIAFAPGHGDGTFGPLATTIVPEAQGQIAIGDFNGDGKLDFAAAHQGSGNNLRVSVFLGNGDGTFVQSSGIDISASGERYVDHVAGGDFNRDGKLDLLVHTTAPVADPTLLELFELVGNGNGTFQNAKSLGTGVGSIAVADLNHDGTPDIVEITSTFPNAPPTFRIRLCQPDGSFPVSSTYAPYAGTVLGISLSQGLIGGSLDPLVADFNGDGNVDIVAYQSGPGYVIHRGKNFDTVATLGNAYAQILSGNGDGTFTPTYDTFNFQKPLFTPQFAADLNGDGRAELIELDGLRSSFHVIFTKPAPALQLFMLSDPAIGDTGHARVTLNVAASGSTSVLLSASDPAIQVPGSLSIPAGQTYQDFSFSFGPGFDPTRVFQIRAQSGGDTAVTYSTKAGATPPHGFAFPADSGGFSMLLPGQSLQSSIHIDSIGGYTATVQISCAGLPATIACQFDTSTFVLAAGGYNGIPYTLSVSPAAVAGSYPFQIVATDSSFTYANPYVLNVGDFSISIVDSQEQAPATGNATFSVVLTSMNNYGGGVALSCQQLPPGATCITTGGAPSPGGTSVPLIVQTSSAVPGQYPFTITASAGGVSHSVSAELDILPPPTFSASATPLGPTTVHAGQSVQYNLSVSAQNFSGSVSLACSSPPAGITCTFNPNPAPISGSSATVSQLTVQTSATILSSSRQLPVQKERERPWMASIFMVLALVEMCSKSRHRMLSLTLAIALASLLCVSCGGGSSTTTQPPPPPPISSSKTFTVTVNATGEGASMAVASVTFTVQP